MTKHPNRIALIALGLAALAGSGAQAEASGDPHGQLPRLEAPSGAPLQLIRLALGASAAVRTVPPLRVQFKSREAATFTLRAVRANGNWSEMRIPAGDSMTVMLEDEDSALLLEPVRTADPKVIRVRVWKVGVAAY